MHETQRFALALTGIGGCLCIAAGIVVTGLADVTAVPVPGVPTTHGAEMLPRLPMPSWSDVTSDVTTARMTRKARAATNGSGVATTAAATASAPVTLQSSIVNRQFTPPPLPQAAWLVGRPLEALPVPLMLSHAPGATGADVVFAKSRARDRDAVTGAFVTAGTHVGKSFRTVGRTLKRVF